MAPEWLKRTSWNKEHLVFPFTREEIKDAPKYDPEIPIARVYEEELHEFYEKDKYWEA